MKTSIAASLLILALAAPATAGNLEFAGDGSGTNNPDLLREAVDGMDGACSDCDPGPSIVGYDDPYFDLDWRLALRGGYVQDSQSGNYWDVSAVPTLTLSHASSRGSLSLTGTAEIARSELEQARLAAFRVAVAGDYLLDEVTILSADVSASLTRPAFNAPGNGPTIVQSPQTLQGGANVSVQRRFGGFNVQLRGNGQRTIVGPTTQMGGIVVDNTSQNNISGGGGLRLAIDMSPTFSLFTDLSAAYARYDAPSPTFGVLFDGPTYTAKAGISARWSGMLTTEASVGIGLRQYDTAALADFQSVLYDGRITFTPDETWTFNTILSTTLQPPGSSGGNGRVVYSLGTDARYRVNPWLALRANASWTRTAVVGAPVVETSYALGVGADYAVNDNVTVNADYTFSKADTPAREIHRWMLGLTFAK